MLDAAQQLHACCLKHHKTIAFAESCTGGQLAAAVTAIAGASEYFLGSLVVYSNQMKEMLLGVVPQTLAIEGAVSEQTVREMTEGVFRLIEVDYVLGVTGIAGPDGGTEQIPVGTVWSAMGKKNGEIVACKHHFAGSRQEVIQAVTHALLIALARFIGEMESAR